MPGHSLLCTNGKPNLNPHLICSCGCIPGSHILRPKDLVDGWRHHMPNMQALMQHKRVKPPIATCINRVTLLTDHHLACTYPEDYECDVVRFEFAVVVVSIVIVISFDERSDAPPQHMRLA